MPPRSPRAGTRMRPASTGRVPNSSNMPQTRASDALNWPERQSLTGLITPSMPTTELQAALEAALAAAQVIRSLFQKNLSVRSKADASPVTEADLRAEEVIREHLTRAFPGYGFYGEETGQHAMQAESLWLVDPIDGTKAFVRENPFFSTQIALMRAGELVLGVSNAPAYGELAWAEVGAGAWLNERRVHVSAVAELPEAALSGGNLKSLA